MQTPQYPDFKAGYKYQNIGNIVGTLNYAKAMKRKDESEYGIEFLLNARGFGSINVRIPMMDRAQSSLDNYPVEDKPRVRAGLTRIEQFVSDKGKRYTNATTFVELSDATTVNGEEMRDNIAGRLGGEVFNIRQIQGEKGPAIQFQLVTYPLNKDDENKRAANHDGTLVDPQVLTLEVHDPQLVQQFQNSIQNGTNAEFGYRYFNKSNVKYDDFGYPINDPNDVIERLEVGKITVHSANNQGGGAFGNQGGGFGGGQQQQGFGNQNQGFGNQQQGNFGNQQQGGFGGQQQGGFGGNQQGGFQQQQDQQQNNPFGQQQQQQNNPFGGQQDQGFGDPNQYNMPNDQIPFMPEYNGPQGQQGQQQGFGNQGDPFGGGQEINQGHPDYEETQRIFNQGGQQGGFGFGN